jgi:hypothetical protein
VDDGLELEVPAKPVDIGLEVPPVEDGLKPLAVEEGLESRPELPAAELPAADELATDEPEPEPEIVGVGPAPDEVELEPRLEFSATELPSGVELPEIEEIAMDEPLLSGTSDPGEFLLEDNDEPHEEAGWDVRLLMLIGGIHGVEAEPVVCAAEEESPEVDPEAEESGSPLDTLDTGNIAELLGSLERAWEDVHATDDEEETVACADEPALDEAGGSVEDASPLDPACEELDPDGIAGVESTGSDEPCVPDAGRDGVLDARSVELSRELFGEPEGVPDIEGDRENVEVPEETAEDAGAKLDCEGAAELLGLGSGEPSAPGHVP